MVWKQFRLTGHSCCVEDPVWVLDLDRVEVLESELQKALHHHRSHQNHQNHWMWTGSKWTTIEKDSVYIADCPTTIIVVSLTFHFLCILNSNIQFIPSLRTTFGSGWWLCCGFQLILSSGWPLMLSRLHSCFQHLLWLMGAIVLEKPVVLNKDQKEIEHLTSVGYGWLQTNGITNCFWLIWLTEWAPVKCFQYKLCLM